MKPINYFLLLLLFSFSISACKKSGLENTPKKSDTLVDVYVSGNIETLNNKNVAAYWKNGIITRLTDSLSSSFASGIAVQGKDVYVSGTLYSADFSTVSAVYWKNGTVNKLNSPSNDSQAFGIAIQGNDIYVIGITYNNTLKTFQATYWKNGIPVTLPGGTTASAIAIAGNDVYVAGTAGTGNNIAAVYWKNGIAATLAGGLQANAITVHGNDIFIGGNMANGASGYWKNGIPTVLTNNSVANQSAYNITGIATNGTDVFVAGSTLFVSAANSSNANSWGSVATLWKNNVPATLYATPLNNSATSVSLYGSDVYTVNEGVNNGPNSFVSGYWKNSTAVQLTNGGSRGASPNGIVVVSRN